MMAAQEWLGGPPPTQLGEWGVSNSPIHLAVRKDEILWRRRKNLTDESVPLEIREGPAGGVVAPREFQGFPYRHAPPRLKWPTRHKQIVKRKQDHIKEFFAILTFSADKHKETKMTPKKTTKI